MSSYERRRDDRYRRDDRFSRSDRSFRDGDRYGRRDRSRSPPHRGRDSRDFDRDSKKFKTEDSRDSRWQSGVDSKFTSKSEYSTKPEFTDKKSFIEKELPNFEVTGVLAEEQNQRNGVPLLFSVSMDAAKPDASNDWRLYEFAGEDNLRTEKLEGFSCFLFGTDERLADDRSSDDVAFVRLTDASCSRQHAVIQFRNRGSVKPYIMDLSSSNKTRLNGASIEPGRYVELRHQDVVQFGRCPNEFVLLNASFE